MTTKPCEPSANPPTLDDLDALPSDIVGEIIEGVLYTMPYPGLWHQYAVTGVACDLHRAFARRCDRWWIIHRLPIELPGGTLEIRPDVAGWLRKRVPHLTNDPIRVVPDWVCEIVEPNARFHEQRIKLPYYAKVGVAYHWLVDLEARTMTARRLEGGDWRVIGTYTGTHRGKTEARIEPFDAAPLDVAIWWPEDGPATPWPSRVRP